MALVQNRKKQVCFVAIFFALILILALFFHYSVHIENALTSQPAAGFSVKVHTLRVIFEPIFGPFRAAVVLSSRRPTPGGNVGSDDLGDFCIIRYLFLEGLSKPKRPFFTNLLGGTQKLARATPNYYHYLCGSYSRYYFSPFAEQYDYKSS
ncbi:MAG: hypothetical protein GXO75_07810 [Calditrichaeota bacterium]|nr:hypothetical protein [Calditrichota bacterium]